MDNLFYFPVTSPIERAAIKLADLMFDAYFSDTYFFELARACMAPDFGAAFLIETSNSCILTKLRCWDFVSCDGYDVPRKIDFRMQNPEETWSLVVRYDLTIFVDEEFLFTSGMHGKDYPRSYIGGIGDGEAARQWLMMWQLKHKVEDEE